MKVKCALMGGVYVDGTCGLCGQLCPGYVEPETDRSSEKEKCDGCDDCKCDETEEGKEL